VRGWAAVTYFPKFLTSPDPDRDPDKVRRLALAYPSIVAYQAADRPLRLNEGTIYEEFLTLDIALPMFERLAEDQLP
jgi:hypothetical protein